jgi:uncharacterized protein YerC
MIKISPEILSQVARAYAFNRGRLTEQDIEAVKDILAKAKMAAEKRTKRKFRTKPRKRALPTARLAQGCHAENTFWIICMIVG